MQSPFSGPMLWAGARKRNKVWLLPVERVVYQREMMLEVCAEHIGPGTWQ